MAVPVAVGELVITGTGIPTAMTRVAEPVPLELIALMVALVVPVAVGVPEINPVLVFTLNPDGRLAALKLVGLPEAVIW